MLDLDTQEALDKALTTGAATYSISENRRALVLAVEQGDAFIPLLDQIFGSADLDFIQNKHRSSQTAVPVLTIAKYAVGPKIERKEVGIHQTYEFMYSERK
ncbi:MULTISPECIES: hypothetical protein [unclassified Thiocapsa]|uniref:hypothetical protein n=1 Tax=unclassified Thiocapsa TaxID=2641286 RepID=UPI0035AF00D8